MMRATLPTAAVSHVAAALLLLAAVVVSGAADALSPEGHPVVGRYSIISEAGGAVWTFQPGGTLVLIGPGEIVSEGTWTPAPGSGEFDAQVDAAVTGQRLEVLGAVTDDGERVAVFVTATEPERPDDWIPWPAESRLIGERFGMSSEPTPSPSPPPADCARPAWIDGVVDWDRCHATRLTQP
jgi:hypothetical protein